MAKVPAAPKGESHAAHAAEKDRLLCGDGEDIPGQGRAEPRS